MICYCKRQVLYRISYIRIVLAVGTYRRRGPAYLFAFSLSVPEMYRNYIAIVEVYRTY